jgi:putative transposase
MLREGVKTLISQAIEAELAKFVTTLSERRVVDHKATVVHNSHLPQSKRQTDAGSVTVRMPKVRSKAGQLLFGAGATVYQNPQPLPATLPWVHLKGVVSGEIGEALKGLLQPKKKAYQRVRH